MSDEQEFDIGDQKARSSSVGADGANPSHEEGSRESNRIAPPERSTAPLHAIAAAPLRAPSRWFRMLNERRAEWWKKPREKARWTDVVIVFLTCGIVALAIMQWREMRSSGTQTDRIIGADERIARAMEDSISQSARSLSAVVGQMRSDQRAWMGATEVAGFPSIGKPFIVTVTLKNGGRSPALDASLVACIEGVTRGSRPDIKQEDRLASVGYGIVQPGTEIYFHGSPLKHDPLMTKSRAEPLLSEDIRVYVHGIIRYKDVSRTSHWTTFCYYLSTEGYEPCGYHNDTDTN